MKVYFCDMFCMWRVNQVIEHNMKHLCCIPQLEIDLRLFAEGLVYRYEITMTTGKLEAEEEKPKFHLRKCSRRRQNGKAGFHCWSLTTNQNT